ncbi:MAG TPA: ABC transporter permease [Candidatus Limnocylindrales bacterium]|nr:ABC transporter permease [Candidatus Limnocylindrales bacterium]
MKQSWRMIWAKMLGRRNNFDQELDEEVRAHIEMETEENVAGGMSPEEARFAALRTFGNVAHAKEGARWMWTFRWLHEFFYDVRFALRTLIKNPGFTAVALLTLALGIGGNSAIFSVVNAVLLKSLPYPEADRLVVLDEYKLEQGSRTVSWMDYQDWRQQSQAFDELAAFKLTHVTLTGAEEPVLLRAAEVSAPFFDLLGVHPATGRSFSQLDDKAGASATAVVSYAFWQSRMGGDASMTQKALTLDGVSYSVVGVLPPGFNFFEKQVDVYLPVGLHGSDALWNRRGFHPDLLVLARLRAGVSRDAARSQMDTLMGRLQQEYPHSNAGMLASVTPLYQQKFGSIQSILLMLFAAVGCVLLIAAVNVANLLLARGSARRREMAVRVALGAGAGRLVRQLLAESVTLSLLGSALGIGFAAVGLRVLLHLAPQAIPQLAATRVDGNVVWFTLGLSLVTGLLFGTFPALQASRVNVSASFKEDNRSGAGRAGKRLRSMLMVAEMAFALVLVTAAGLLVRSLFNAANADPGFRPEHILAMDVMLQPGKYADASQQSVFYIQAVRRLQALPGVRMAGAAFCPPLVGVCASNAFTLADRPVATVADLPTAAANIVVPGYFEAIQVPLLEGRFFTESDTRDSRLVAIVNRSFARLYWPNASAIGKLIKEGGPERNEPFREVVGIVADIKQNGMDGDQKPEVFFPVTQFPFAPWDSLRSMTFVVRTQGEPVTVISDAKNAVQVVDKDLPVTAIRPMKQDEAESLARREFSTVLLGVFGGLALILAAVGTYGVMAYSVSQRRQEIGTRMALGATAADVRRLVLGEAMSLAAKAVLLGLVGAWISTRWLRGLLFGVKASDPVTFGAVCTALAAVALIASYVPMRRAIRVDPATALRTE